MEGALDELLRHPALWRARERLDGGEPSRGAPVVATGFPELDRRLPGGGWPLGTLVEVMPREPGIGELSLLLPALAGLARRGRWLAWIAPPHRIAAPALQAAGVDPARVLVVRGTDRRRDPWAAEQALRSGACGAVLWWCGRPERSHGFRRLRRLQLAAREGGGLGVVFRCADAARDASPAALRLLLQPVEEGLRVHLLKSRGGSRRDVTLRVLRPGCEAP